MPTTRRRRLFKFLAITLISLVVILLVITVGILPWFVRERLYSKLSELGLTATFKVPVATFREAVIKDIRIGDHRIDRMLVHYSISTIRGGPIDYVGIDGLHLVAKVDDRGNLDLGPLDVLLSKREKQPAEIPITHIDLKNSSIILQGPHHEIRLPIDATVQGIQTDAYNIQARSNIGSPLNLSGTIHLGGGATNLQLRGQNLDAESLTQIASALVPNAGAGLRGHLNADINFVHDNNTSTLTADLAATPAQTPAPAGANAPNLLITGGVLHVEANFANAASALVTVQDASFTERSQNVVATGITGKFNLAKLDPPSSPPRQRVQIAQVKIGNIAFNNGIIIFQMTGPQSFNIANTRWDWLGGQILANNATISSDDLSLTLQANNIDLQRLLKEFAQEKASGTGAVSGEIKLAYSNGALRIAGGSFRSAAGGTLNIGPADAIAAQIAPNLGIAASDPQLKSQVADALRNFQFTQITADLSREPDGLVGHVHITGHGRTGMTRPITYDLNVRGLDRLIQSVLGVREAINRHQNMQ